MLRRDWGRWSRYLLKGWDGRIEEAPSLSHDVCIRRCSICTSTGLFLTPNADEEECEDGDDGDAHDGENSC